MSNILALDVAELTPALGRFWSWWRGELAALAQPLLRERRSAARGHTVVAVDAAGRLDAASPRSAKGAALRLPPERVLRRSISMPSMSARDLQRLVLMDADRLTPFADGAAYHHLRVSPIIGQDGSRDVRLLSIDRVFVDGALAAAAEAGLKVHAVLAPDDAADTDLLPLIRAGQADPQAAAKRALWALAALLVALNVGMWMWRDVQRTEALEAQADAAQSAARKVSNASRQDDALKGLISRASAGPGPSDPVFGLDLVARTLPQAATLQKLDWRFGQLRLQGVKPAELDVASALRIDPAVSGLHPMADGASTDRFDLSLRLTSLRRLTP